MYEKKLAILFSVDFEYPIPKLKETINWGGISFGICFKIPDISGVLIFGDGISFVSTKKKKTYIL